VNAETVLSNFNMAEKLWDLANVITGFAVVQSLATILALLGGTLKISEPVAYRYALWALGGFTALYVVAIGYCGVMGYKIDNNHLDIWTVTTVARVVVVLIFTGLLFLAIKGSLVAKNQT
jgi:hypothetical protein